MIVEWSVRVRYFMDAVGYDIVRNVFSVGVWHGVEILEVSFPDIKDFFNGSGIYVGLGVFDAVMTVIFLIQFFIEYFQKVLILFEACNVDSLDICRRHI